MALPTSIETVIVTGEWLDAQGNPCTGNVVFEPAPCAVKFQSSKVFVDGPKTATLGTDGKISITLVASDATGAEPSGFTYRVTERVSCADCVRMYNIYLPADAGIVDLTQVAPVAADQGDIVQVVGPQGPAGRTPEPLSGVGPPASTTGQDGDLYVDSLTGVMWGNQDGTWVELADLTGPPGGIGTTDAYLAAGQSVTFTGTGTESSPYLVNAAVSSDAGNTLTYGTDGNLFTVGGTGEGVVTSVNGQIGDVALTATDVGAISKVGAGNGITVTTVSTVSKVTAKLSTNSNQGLKFGTDGGLYVQKASTTAVEAAVKALKEQVAALKSQLTALKPTAWTTLKLASNVRGVSVGTGSASTPKFRYVAGAYAELIGSVERTDGKGWGSAGTLTIGTITDTKARPRYQMQLPVVTDAYTATAQDVPTVWVETNGTVRLGTIPATSANPVDIIYMSGLRWPLG